jgi:tripartite-type tricarboxylate transporter receptor subunit TctC
VACNYLHQKPGDPHALVLCSPVLLTNHISGVIADHVQHFTPISMMMSEYQLFVVKAIRPARRPRI